MKIAAEFLLLAVPRENNARHNIAGGMLTFRPQISDIGPQQLGPNAKPTLLVGDA
jgi:hypothetical protein